MTFREYLCQRPHLKDDVLGRLARYAATHDDFPQRDTSLEAVQKYLKLQPDGWEMDDEVRASATFAWGWYQRALDPPKVDIVIDLSAADDVEKP